MTPHSEATGGRAGRRNPRPVETRPAPHSWHPRGLDKRAALRLDDAAAQCAADLAAEATKVHLTGVALFDPVGTVKMQAAAGHRTRAWAELVIPRESIAHRMRRTGRIQRLSNYARESGSARWLIDMFCIGEGAFAVAAVPLRQGDEVVGVLYGAVREPVSIGDSVLGSLEKVAQLTAAATHSRLAGEAASDPDAPDRAAVAELTGREMEMLAMLAEGLSTREIAEGTGLAVNSVRTYIQSTLTKLGCGSRLEAVARARSWGVL